MSGEGWKGTMSRTEGERGVVQGAEGEKQRKEMVESEGSKEMRGPEQQQMVKREIAGFVTKTAAFATVVGSVSILWSILFNRFKEDSLGLASELRLSLWDATYPDPVLLPNATSAKGRLKESVGSTPTTYVSFVFFYPVALYFYLGKENFPKKGMGMAVVAYFVTLFLGYGVAGIGLLFMTNVVYAVLFVVIALRCGLPSDSKIYKLILYQLLGIHLLGTVVVNFGLPNFPLHDEYFQWAYYLSILPLFREFTRFLATKTAWYFRFDVKVGGRNVTLLHRECAFVFLLWVLVLWATYYRLVVANMKSTAKSVVVVLYQAVLELGLRVTLFQREKAMKEATSNVKQCCTKEEKEEKSRKNTVIALEHMTKVAPTSILAMQRATTRGKEDEEKATRNLAQRDFISMVVLIDMMAEYVGIMNSFILLISYTDKPLISPYNWYIDNVLGKESEDVDRSALIFTALLQFGMEMVVDSLCLYFDRKTDPLSIWKSLNKRKFIPLFIMASWYGSVLAVTMFVGSDNVDKCMGADLCYCVNNGLMEGGVLEAYCFLIYPNANWTTTPPILGPHLTTLTP